MQAQLSNADWPPGHLLSVRYMTAQLNAYRAQYPRSEKAGKSVIYWLTAPAVAVGTVAGVAWLQYAPNTAPALVTSSAAVEPQ